VLGCMLSSALLMAGCATVYRSPGAEQTPVSELAILSVKSKNASIRKIDGVLRLVGTIKKLELTPGVRSITSYLVSGYAPAGEVTIEFEARAGEEYELMAARNVEQWRWESWIVRKGTDVVVSNRVAAW